MKWFLAKIVFRIQSGSGRHCPQFDEQLRLISAAHDAEAYEKAKAIGESEEDSFYNYRQELVQWQFVNISELYQLPGLSDGLELYSRINEVEDGDAYINFVHSKAGFIEERQQHQLLKLT